MHDFEFQKKIASFKRSLMNNNQVNDHQSEKLYEFLESLFKK